jgi:hypothetical protein
MEWSNGKDNKQIRTLITVLGLPGDPRGGAFGTAIEEVVDGGAGTPSSIGMAPGKEAKSFFAPQVALAHFNERLHHVRASGWGRHAVGSARPGGEAGSERDEKEPKITGLEGPAGRVSSSPGPGSPNSTGIARYLG